MNSRECYQLKRKVNDCFDKKEFSEREVFNLERLIDKLKDIDLYFYNYYKGKLLIMKGELEKAEEFLKKAIVCDYQKVATYYALFKIKVQKKQFADANNYLDIYEDKSSRGTDFSLMRYFINILNGEDVKFDGVYNGMYGVSKIDDLEIEKLFLEIYNLLNLGNLKEVLRCLLKLKDYIFAKNYPIEVDTLILLVEETIDKKERDFLNSFGKDISVFFEEGKKSQAIAFFRALDKLSVKDFKSASTILEMAKKKFSGYEAEIKYLSTKINEISRRSQYSDSKKKQLKTYQELGRAYLVLGAYPEAFYTFEAGKYLTGDNEFNYYIGKTLYKAGMINEALKVMKKYLVLGGKRYSKALTYLMAGSFRNHDFIMTKNCEDKINKLSNVFGENFYINNYDFKSADFDSSKAYAYRHLNMSLDEFEFNDLEYDRNLYHNYSFKDKIFCIKNLYKEGQIILADKLLNELIPTSSNERYLKNNVERNKVLYINKIRSVKGD